VAWIYGVFVNVDVNVDVKVEVGVRLAREKAYRG
jgi:hypothetical protein